MTGMVPFLTIILICPDVPETLHAVGQYEKKLKKKRTKGRVSTPHPPTPNLGVITTKYN